MSTRSELKENLLATKLEGVLKWVLEYRGPVLTGAGVAVAALLLGSVFILRSSQQKEMGRTRLAFGKDLVMQRQYDRAALEIADLKKSISDRSLLAQASYYQGLAALGQKKYDDAAKFFSEATDESGVSPLKPLALSNLGFAQEQAKDYKGASAAYGRFMSEFPEHFLAARTQLALGRTLVLAGDLPAAKQALTHLIDLYPTSHWAENARSIMDKNKIR